MAMNKPKLDKFGKPIKAPIGKPGVIKIPVVRPGKPGAPKNPKPYPMPGPNPIKPGVMKTTRLKNTTKKKGM